MPPVAQEMTPWGEAILRELHNNAERKIGPSSWRGLAAAMANQPEATQTRESYLNKLKDIRKEWVPNERWAKLIAAGLQVERASLPEASVRLSLQGVLAIVDEALASLDAMRETLGALAERVDLLEQQQHGHGGSRSVGESPLRG